MNYTQLLIDEQKIGLKFGMASFRYLQDKFVDGIAFKDNELNEIGIAHILYSGYFNNCIVKDVVPELTLEFFVDWIEQNLNNEEAINDIKRIIEMWSSNEFIKQTQVKEEPKKKTIRGKK